MIVDIDTRKLELKKGDMLIFDGKQMSVLNKEELLKSLKDDIEKLFKAEKSHNVMLKKIDKFIRRIGGKFNEEN